MENLLQNTSLDVEFLQVSGFYIVVYGIILCIYFYVFKNNWNRVHAFLKGTGFIALIAVPIYGFAVMDSTQFLKRGRELGGARFHASIEAPAGIVLPDGGCGALCQELLLENHIRFAEVAQSDPAVGGPLRPPMRYEKRTAGGACMAIRAERSAAEVEAEQPAATGLVPLAPDFQAAAALDTCIAYRVIEQISADIVVRTWPAGSSLAPVYIGQSNTEHHEIFRRGEGLAVARMLAESEAAWVKVLAFPPRIKRPEKPGGVPTFTTKLSYGAPTLQELLNKTLSLELDGRLDISEAARPKLMAALKHKDPSIRAAAAKAIDAQGPAAEGKPAAN